MEPPASDLQRRSDILKTTKRFSMRLQTKLSLGLMAAVLLVYLGSCFFQYYRNMETLAHFSQKSQAGESSVQWQWVERLQQATHAPLIDAMTEGEMDKFEKSSSAIAMCLVCRNFLSTDPQEW